MEKEKKTKMETTLKIKKDCCTMFDSLRESWGADMVPRSQIHKFTKGLLKRGTVSNLDTKGKFVAKIKIGNRVCYRAQDIVEWLKQKAGC